MRSNMRFLSPGCPKDTSVCTKNNKKRLEEMAANILLTEGCLVNQKDGDCRTVPHQFLTRKLRKPKIT